MRTAIPASGHLRLAGRFGLRFGLRCFLHFCRDDLFLDLRGRLIGRRRRLISGLLISRVFIVLPRRILLILGLEHILQ
ncbi:MAG TPA: hypothetical protein PKX52_02315, partial [Methanomassiliicoccaceae archaeon]|nr:hypothetical protein [Methanomassiliicoccaceae archaeon]